MIKQYIVQIYYQLLKPNDLLTPFAGTSLKYPPRVRLLASEKKIY